MRQTGFGDPWWPETCCAATIVSTDYSLSSRNALYKAMACAYKRTRQAVRGADRMNLITWLSEVWRSRAKPPIGARSRYTMGVIVAQQSLDLTNSIPPCAWIAAYCKRRTFSFYDVWDHLRSCDACNHRIGLRTKAGFELANAAIRLCSRLEKLLDAADSFPKDRYEAHTSMCAACAQRMDTIKKCTASIALSDYMPGCYWLEERFRADLCSESEITRHLKTCSACSARISYLAGEYETQ